MPIRLSFISRPKKFLILTLLAFLMGACAHQPVIPEGTEAEFKRSSLSVGEIRHPFDLFPEYHIVPGDTLDILFQIQTWKEQSEFKLSVDQVVTVKFEYNPELNETQSIRPDGTISLPMVGNIRAAGKTVDALTNDLKTRYSQILRDSDLHIIVSGFRSAIQELKKDLYTSPRGLSRLTTVRPDGYATFPMVGDVFVAGKSIPEANKILNEKYEQILESLHCDLFLEKQSGSLVYIIGEVKQPGGYDIKRPITVIEALALAGGYSRQARLDSVVVVRKQKDAMRATRINISNTLSLKEDSVFVYLQPGDIVYVPQTPISQAAEVAAYIRSITFFNGWDISLEALLWDRSLF